MTLWLDEQISPYLAPWILLEFGCSCKSIAELGLQGANDLKIFLAAREKSTVLLTKDRDFIDLVTRQGPPPSVILLTCGNRSNEKLKDILKATLPAALLLVSNGETTVEIA